MDNITHSLAGALVGGWAASRTQTAKSAVIAASLLANNFPDSDAFYAPLLSQPLGYILHHRGHTHTIIGAVGCGILSWLIIRGICRMRGFIVDHRANRLMAAVSIFGALLHLALDSLNTYGVHPFWPLDNHWYYGDSVFIIEPLLWICLGLAASCSSELRRCRKLFAAVSIIGIALIVFSGLVPPKLIALYGFLGLLLGVAHMRIAQSWRIGFWSAVSVAVLFLFSMSGRMAAAIQPPPSPPGNFIMSFIGPTPANPLCWSWLEMRKTEETIVYEQQFIQPFKSTFPVDCARYSMFRTVENQSDNSVEWSLPRGAFKSISSNCRWSAFRQFARVPTLQQSTNGTTIATDVRFSRQGAKGFSSVPLDGSCPMTLPPWEPPVDRQKLE